MIDLGDEVILIEDIKGTQYVIRDRGTVVAINPDSKGYEIEFFDVDNETRGIATVLPNQIMNALEYWLSKTPQERLSGLEDLRFEYIKKHFNGIRPPFQRVYNSFSRYK
jgi:hypothetical protein